MTDKPITVIRVLCDARKIQRIAITCRCSQRWTEQISSELYDSNLIAEFECERCKTRYHLHHKQLHRVMENNNDRSNTEPFATVRIDNNKQEYDA